MNKAEIESKFVFSLPTKIEYGLGVSKLLSKEVINYNSKKVLVVTDPGIINAGLIKPFEESLKNSNISHVLFGEVEANPRTDTVNKAALFAKDEKVDCIVGIGGGSSIDAAKAIATVFTLGGEIQDYEGFDKLTYPLVPTVAIPTTAGTGSEVTSWSVITDTVRKEKIGIGSKYLYPSVALVDPELTYSLPKTLTAATGMDALTHAIEAYTARCSNPISDILALKAINLISNNLARAVKEGDLVSRERMMLASLLAGIAFGNSDTGAVHSMAEALGGMFDVPHGLANAIFLPHIMEFNLPVATKRLVNIGEAMGVKADRTMSEADLAKLSIEAVCELSLIVGISSLPNLLIEGTDIEELSIRAFHNLGTPDNAREISIKDFELIFHKVLYDS